MANELLAHKADLPEITAVFGASFSDIYEFVTPGNVKYSALQKKEKRCKKQLLYTPRASLIQNGIFRIKT